jgi:hypothetical protein
MSSGSTITTVVLSSSRPGSNPPTGRSNHNSNLSRETLALAGYELVVTPQGAVVRIRYKSSKTLDKGIEDALARVLRAKLKSEHLPVELEGVTKALGR